MSKIFEEIDHTADIGIRIYGQRLEELFINAGIGMFQVMRSDADNELLGKDRNAEHKREIQLKASDSETLLRDWMAELLYLHTTDRLYFTKFHVHSLSDRSIQGSAEGFKISNADENHIMDIKAVTYHGLEVKEASSGFTAQVIFDI